MVLAPVDGEEDVAAGFEAEGEDEGEVVVVAERLYEVWA